MTQEFTLREMQQSQPWTVPYSGRFEDAATAIRLPYLHATHAVLHAAKTVGKLSAVYEALDHRETATMLQQEATTVAAMAADLVTVAMRLANLHGFDLHDELCRRVLEKNGVGYSATPAKEVKS